MQCNAQSLLNLRDARSSVFGISTCVDLSREEATQSFSKFQISVDTCIPCHRYPILHSVLLAQSEWHRSRRAHAHLSQVMRAPLQIWPITIADTAEGYTLCMSQATYRTPSPKGNRPRSELLKRQHTSVVGVGKVSVPCIYRRGPRRLIR